MTAFQSEWQERFGRTEPKVLCVGLNYSDHADESGMKRPAAPLLFGKFANTICGDGDAIALPANIGHVDAEAELAVVIGEIAHCVPAASAYDVIAGYTCANDVSA
ncbi:MAG: fumarylacetoacetate hydrolase family protein, partial [Solirubrobacteraceae bacterium]